MMSVWSGTCRRCGCLCCSARSFTVVVTVLLASFVIHASVSVRSDQVNPLSVCFRLSMNLSTLRLSIETKTPVPSNPPTLRPRPRPPVSLRRRKSKEERCTVAPPSHNQNKSKKVIASVGCFVALERTRK
jgi:hypothetical protein